MKYLFILLLALALSPLASQHPELRYYGSSQTKISGSFWQVEQSKTGNLYAATHEGIAIYNGNKWNLVKNRLQTPIYSISKEKNCRIYAGGLEDLGYLDFDENNKYYYHSLYHLLPERLSTIGRIWKTIEHNNQIYFQGEKYIAVWNGESFASIFPDNNTFFLCHKINNELWVQEEGIGLFKIQDANKKYIKGSEVFNNINIFSILPIGSDKFLILSNERGIERYQLQNNELTKIDDPSLELSAMFQNQSFYTAHVLNDGSYLFGFKSSLLLHCDKNLKIIQEINQNNSTIKGEIWNIFEDQSQYLWISSSNGLYQLDLNPKYNTFPSNIFNDNYLIKSIEIGNDIIGCTKYNIYKKHNSKFNLIYVSNKAINDILKFDEEKFLILKEKELIIYKEKEISKLNIDYCFKIEPYANKNQFVLAAPHQIFIVEVNDNNSLQVIKGIIIEDQEVKDIIIDNEGRIWFNTLIGGVGVWYLDQVHYYRENEGLNSLMNIRLLKYENQIIAANENGIFALLYTKNKAVQSRKLSDFFTSQKWILRNLIELKEGFIAHVLEDGESKIVQIKDTHEGLEIIQNNLKLLPNQGLKTISKVKDNLIFFSYADKLFEYNVHSASNKRLPFPVQFEQILYPVKGNIDFNQKTITAKYNKGELSFKFSSPHYYFFNDIKYFYRLKNYANSFTSIENEEKVAYNNLKEGRYTFEVYAQDKFGNTSDISSLSIIITAPWFRTIWFRIGLIFFIGTFIVLIFKWRNNYLIKRNKALEEVIQLRTQELEKEKLELLESKEELFELGKQKNDLLGIAAHDLKNPLSAIDGINSLLTQSIDIEEEIPIHVKEEYKEYLSMIEKSSKQMKNIIEDILNSVKLDRNKQSIVLQPYNILELLDEHFALLNNYAKQKKINIIRNYNADVSVHIDDKKMGEVFQNLLSNAIKYSKEGTQVILSTQLIQVNDKNHVRISIQDEGPGFTEEDKSKMFQMFQRLSAKPTKGESSTGLGLYIVKNYTELNKGFVELDSVYGQGSTFHIYLPIQESIELN